MQIAHDEFTPDEIKKGIERPIAIYEGTLPDTDIYFSRTSSSYPRLYIKTAVSVYPEGGDIMTSFLSKSISGGIVPAEEGGIKYYELKNEL